MALAKTPHTIIAGNGILYYDTSGITISGSATLLSLFSTIHSRCKNLVITPPKGDVVKVDLFGETSNFQNYILDERSWELAKVSGTIQVNSDAEDFEPFIVGGGTAAVTGSYTRYQYGSSESAKTRVKVGALLLHFIDGARLRSVLLDNAYFTSLGDIKVTGADGHWERDFEAVCAPVDFNDEYLD